MKHLNTNIHAIFFIIFVHSVDGHLRPVVKKHQRCIDLDGERGLVGVHAISADVEKAKLPPTIGGGGWVGRKVGKPPSKTLCLFEMNIDGSLISADISWKISYTHRARWNDIHNHYTKTFSITLYCLYVHLRSLHAIHRPTLFSIFCLSVS